MSVHCHGGTKESKDKQEDVASKEDSAKTAAEESPNTSSLSQKRKAEKTVAECTTSKNKRHSPDSVKRRRKADGESEAQSANAPSDLSTGGSREEKDKAETCSDNTALVAEHYNILPQNGLEYRNQSRIVYMRNFNNWIKSMLINEFMSKVKQNKMHGSSMKVLDMCCGKGGDLLKWRRANISHLVCIDIAKLAVEQCQQRYNDMIGRSRNQKGFGPVFTAEFIAADCTRVRLREKLKDPSMQLDFVSCQFAFHYSFESLQQAECMFRNVSETLKPGGYFVGTIPDAYDLVWQKCEGNKFGNDIYSVEFHCEDKTNIPLFGAKYNFYLDGVVDCPEFLVHRPTFVKLASKFGLELVFFERFENYYERMKNEGKSLLVKIQALETYPPYHETPLLGQAGQDYQHAVQYMQNLPDHRKIGTLSQAEWDATSIYAVFAFQKMKTVWNSDGKPEYVKL